MTALAAYWDLGAPAPDAARRLLAAQSIYGKHDATWAGGTVELGRRLWPLLPEDRFDRGPLCGGDGSIMLVADVRLDNRDDLIAALGLSSASLSDADIVLALVERHGRAALSQLIGAFALILWDARAKQLVLARDYMGERPLHYHRGKGFVAVASMPRALHVLPGIACAADVTMTASFLALIPETGSESFFAGIARVPPGSVVTIDADGERVSELWRPSQPRRVAGGRNATIEFVRECFDMAVACRLRRAAGGIGSHLSAGLDSGGVTATAARLNATETLFAYTAVPAHGTPATSKSIADEGPLAAAVAAMYPAIVHRRIAPSSSAVALLDRQFDLFQRPVLNPANAAWNEAIGDAARADGVTVLLTGQMGNLTISHHGYPALADLAARGRMIALAGYWRRLRRRGMSLPALANLSFGPLLPPRWWAVAMTRLGRGLALDDVAALRAEAIERHALVERAQARGLDFAYPPWRNGRAMRLWGLRRVDMGVYLKGMLAGWGVDMRDPTADRRLVEITLALPEAAFIAGGVPRALARQIFADRLPEVVLAEQRRGIQAADWAVSFGASLAAMREEIAAVARCGDADGLIDVDGIAADLDAWPGENAADPATIARYRHRLLRALAAGHFLRRVARSN